MEKSLEEKLEIATNTLRAIRTRIDNSDDWLNSTMLDIGKSVDNALKIIGGNNNE